MPRTARLAPDKFTYHLLVRGNNRKAIFKDADDYVQYLKIIQKYKWKYKFKLYHYVLMKHHVHLVLKVVPNGGSLAGIMKGINLSYALSYKSRYKYNGHFWQDRYKSIIVSEDEYMLACGAYVELNPVRSHRAGDPREYLWSSFNFYAYGAADPVVDENPRYTSLAATTARRRKAYRAYVKGLVENKNALKGEMNKKIVYGSPRFVQNIIETYRIQADVKPRGRPKKQSSAVKKDARSLSCA